MLEIVPLSILCYSCLYMPVKATTGTTDTLWHGSCSRVLKRPQTCPPALGTRSWSSRYPSHGMPCMVGNRQFIRIASHACQVSHCNQLKFAYVEMCIYLAYNIALVRSPCFSVSPLVWHLSSSSCLTLLLRIWHNLSIAFASICQVCKSYRRAGTRCVVGPA